MSWKRINVKSIKEPKFAEITIGDSRLVMGKTACKLIPNIFRYKHIEFYSDPAIPNKIGILFLENPSDQSLPISFGYSEIADKEHIPIRIFVENKQVLKSIFGPLATNSHSVKCRIYPDSSVSEMIVADLDGIRPAKTKYK